MTPQATTATANAPAKLAADEATRPAPAPGEMKCTLCGLDACWMEKDEAKGEAGG
ncbi:MAG: hypothetical protein O2798_10130 [Chloroflexi bacterium]|nr:hypothetical protein [Chloroflexota bacterium]MDA1241180.1 hypothetical protein [Chloroflexota bacterium]